MIKLIILEKTEDIKNNSHPVNLLSEANFTKKELIANGEFNEELDEFIIIFDRDSFKPVDSKREQYLSFIDKAKESVSIGITNPCFELWLLLHKENILTDIEKNQEDYRQNLKASNKHTFTSKKFSDIFGSNSKTNIIFNELLGVSRYSY